MSSDVPHEKKEVVAIQLLDRTLQIKTSADKAEELQKAASLLSRKMRDVRDSKQAVGNERIALMAGLNLAYELISTQKQKDLYLESISSKIKDLQNRLDDTLSPETKELF